MTRRYFDKFPTINYNGYNVTNITEAAKVVDKYTNAPFVYYRVKVDGSMRPDAVANGYYQDPYMSWMVFYSNRVVDPYYDWPLDYNDFNAFIEKKYGSLETAIKTIVEFRINWRTDPARLTPADFRARFGDYTDPHSKYWNPIYNLETGRILYYVRKANDGVVNTNKLIKVGVSSDIFTAGDLVDIRTVVPQGDVVGTAEVSSVGVGTVFLKNVLGDIGSNYYLCQDDDASINTQVTDYSNDSDLTNTSWTLVNIPATEYVYWEPYTAYQQEFDLNEDKTNIRLVENGVAQKVADQLEKLLDQ